jgi:FkbM family methyltransferase
MFNIFKKKVSTPIPIIKKEYAVGKYNMILKENHISENYRQTYPFYDQFLPKFCSNFEGLIVDIGANIGDTSIAILAQNDNCFIVGVEPDPFFYNDFIENVEINNLGKRVLGINKFISGEAGTFTIKRNDHFSTGSKEIVDISKSSSTNSISISELMEIIPTANKIKFDLLKIDTDGFDWDILNSFIDFSSVNINLPRFIFFEMQTFINNAEFESETNIGISEKYYSAIRKLAENNYTIFCLFDNFGTFIKKTNSINDIIELNEYIRRSQLHNKYSTIYYLDILAYSFSEEQYVDSILTKMYYL